MVNEDFDIDNMFADTNTNPSDVVKELFSEKTIKARTDLSASQISKISRAYYLASILEMPELKSLLDEFITLRISKDRKSRSEFVEGLKSKIDTGILGNNMMNRQFGK